MTTLTLNVVWINLVSTGEAISAPSTDRGQVYGIAGEVRPYAGGRQRFIGQEGEQGQFTITLRRLTLTQVGTLRTWEGKTVLFRDRRGQSMYGVFASVTPLEYKELLYDAAIVIGLVTQDDNV